MVWWGPTGIGSAYTIERYAKQHSAPFRAAFSNRSKTGHIARLAEGHYGGFFGWPNFTAELSGAFMGRPATGKLAEFRVIDLYRRDGDKLAENWVFIDLLHFWKCQGEGERIFMNISGKKAVVFGGTSGIGLATTKMLALGGATVIAVSRDPAKAGPLPEGATTAACDVCDAGAVEALLSGLAPFDILVSAATVRYGAAHVTDGGSITLVSGAPARKCKPGQVALSSVGGAVEALVRAVAHEVAPRIRVNVVSPGTIDTPMVAAQGAERDALYTKMTQSNLVPRAGSADEVAKGLMFVIENDFVTGTTVDVDGGWLLS